MRKLTKYYLKSYALMGKDKESGNIYGYVEHSFSMGLSNTEVRSWPVKSYNLKLDTEFSKNDFAEQQKCQKQIIEMLERDKKTLSLKYPNIEFFIVRLNSKDCPVVIDWKKYHSSTNKYDRRNVSFTKK